MASDAKLKPYCPSRNYNLRISDKTMNLSFLNNTFKSNHMNLFLSDHLLNWILLNQIIGTCFWATICMCWWTRASSSLPADENQLIFTKKRKEKLGFEFENIKRLIPSPLFCSISSSFLMLSSLAVNVCFCVSIRISNSCEDLQDVLQRQSKTYLEACFFVHPSVPYSYFDSW